MDTAERTLRRAGRERRHAQFIGADNPGCACGEWRTLSFDKTGEGRICANCHTYDRLPNHHAEIEAERAAYLRRLEFHELSCVCCSERRVLCLETDHTAGRARAPYLRLLCKNCHRVRTDRQQYEHSVDRPPSAIDVDEAVRLGEADILEIRAEWLRGPQAR